MYCLYCSLLEGVLSKLACCIQHLKPSPTIDRRCLKFLLEICLFLNISNYLSHILRWFEMTCWHPAVVVLRPKIMISILLCSIMAWLGWCPIMCPFCPERQLQASAQCLTSCFCAIMHRRLGVCYQSMHTLSKLACMLAQTALTAGQMIFLAFMTLNLDCLMKSFKA